MLKVLIKGCEPKRGTKGSACVDLFASHDCVIGAGETKLVGLGVAIDSERLDGAIYRELINFAGIDNASHPSVEEDAWKDMWLNSHYLQLMLRSSLGKKGLILPNGVGVIDLDYKDEIKMIIHNPLTFKTASNIAIHWVSNLVNKLGANYSFPTFIIELDGFSSNGGFIVKKEDKDKKIKASKIAQITSKAF